MRVDAVMDVVVVGCRIESDAVRSFELRPADRSVELPAAEAGSHIDVHLPGGLVRQYSLTNPGETRRYVIAVLRDANSRGGSRALHETIRVGERLVISSPRNHFALADEPSVSVLVAGGIGITPLYAMAQRLTELRRDWTLYYCAHSARVAAYVEELDVLAQTAPCGRVSYVFDDASGAKRLDMDEMVRRHGEAAHYYSCGSAPFIASFQEATSRLPRSHVHVEHFSSAAPVGVQEDGAPFDVHLARANKVFRIPRNRSILDVLQEAGVPVLSSCREGICGSCETGVLAGLPQHLDHILTAGERAANKTMMVCVSRCKGAALTLDL